ncbi:MAG TPA: ABC transporter ATP-binding protein [Thermotogota bacterium]|nr:ABC transporter ATP-binding protein [Thermotogota bacterium]HPR95069.1 ABC transporter ATP-binding protein [Thermotogota bacterium]
MADNTDYRLESETAGSRFDMEIFKRLWKYIKPYKFLFIMSLIFLALATVLQLLIPYFTKIAIDNYMSQDYTYSVSLVEAEDAFKVNSDGQEIWIKKDDNGTYKLNYLKGQMKGFTLTNDTTSYYLNPEVMEAFRSNDILSLNNLVLLLVTVLISNFFCTFGQVITSNKMGQKVILDVRKALFDHLMKLPMKFYDTNPAGRIVTRATNDTENLNEFFTTAITSIIKDVLMLIGIVIFMFFISAQLTGYAMIVIPFIVLATVLFRLFARKAFRRVRTRLAAINSFMAEHISGMSVIQLFNREKTKEDEFAEKNQSYYKSTIQQMTVFAIFRPTMDFLFYIGMTTVIWFGAKDLLSGSLTFGILYAFINYIDMLFQPLRDIAEKFNIVQNAFASAEKIFTLMDEEEGIGIQGKDINRKISDGRIDFNDVKLTYDGEKQVLRGISFNIKPDEEIAIVGETGAGKTSLMNILTALYPIQNGNIKIDDISIYDYQEELLRHGIAVVLQDVFLFSGTVLDNIRLFNEDITREQAIEAAKYVHVDHLIDKFEKGFDTQITERATTLSAGERQLIALARAVVSDPKILVLDEATSNIDPVTEGLIQDAMKKVSNNRTVITIAHRLSTIRNADRILVLHKGKLAEQGSHTELMAKDGIYKQLYRLQYDISA